jgi:hypothetical protein
MAGDGDWLASRHVQQLTETVLGFDGGHGDHWRHSQ